MKKAKVCFVSQGIYSLLKKTDLNFIGGAEVQQYLIGVELSKRGYQILFISRDHGQRAVEKVNDFTVIATYQSNKGIPGIRFFYPRLYKIWQALKRSEADIFYVRSAGFIIAVIVIYAKLYKKKVIYCGADDRDFNPKQLRLPTFRDKFLYIFGVKHADAVIVQNKRQQFLLEKHFKRQGQIIHNAFPDINEEISRGETILWVANIRRKKQPELFLDLAKRFPQESFVMVGGPVKGDERLYEIIKKKASSIPNLCFKGFLPLEDAEKEFSRAKIFVNTSSSEGFPNTFIQAWRRGIPVVSFIDPDNLINDCQLGFVAVSFVDMVQSLELLIQGKGFSRWRIRKTFKNRFSLDLAIPQYEKLFACL